MKFKIASILNRFISSFKQLAYQKYWNSQKLFIALLIGLVLYYVNDLDSKKFAPMQNLFADEQYNKDDLSKSKKNIDRFIL